MHSALTPTLSQRERGQGNSTPAVRQAPFFSGSAEARASHIVRALGLTRRFDERAVLNGVSFELKEGEYLCLLGANGAGKSTLLNILATLNSPDEGQLYLFDRLVRRGDAQLRRHLGMIAHQAMLYRDLSAIENLRLFARLYGIAHVEDRCRQMLDMVKLADRADDPVRAFSRGMIQRLSIARAMVHDPKLLLADEPFTGLDLRSTRIVEQLLAQWNAVGKTLVLVNHDIDQSLALSNRVIVLRAGKLAMDASTAQVDRDTVEQEVFGS
ncbi:MAG: ABC transporter ATP-binding protein, partial [Phycisphaeraceae bacterium]|nr:ABC transporter ATP-binding protein [Phycisphaeraceae bacterium]